MTMRRGFLLISIGTLLGAAIYLPLRLQAASGQLPSHSLPPAEAGGVVVGLCDGETSIEVRWLKPGQRMTREQARAVSNALMAKWRQRHSNAEWQTAQAQTSQPGATQLHARRDRSLNSRGKRRMEIGIGDGTTRRFGPGDVVLADDLTGQGHATRSLGVPRISATVPVGA